MGKVLETHQESVSGSQTDDYCGRTPYSQNMRTFLPTGCLCSYERPHLGLSSAPLCPILSVTMDGKGRGGSDGSERPAGLYHRDRRSLGWRWLSCSAEPDDRSCHPHQATAIAVKRVNEGDTHGT